MDLSLALRLAVSFLVAYLLGAVPFALIVGKAFYTTDLREHGSGNLGATNVVRVLGWRAGLAVFVLDVAKGAVAVVVAMLLVPDPSPLVRDWALIGATFAAVLGHSYSPYIRFRGGKGVATAAGGLLIVTPLAWPILFLTFLTIVVATRIVSLGSIVIAVEFPLLVLAIYPDRTPVVIVSFVAAALVLWRHRSNMGRILRGEEGRISLRGDGKGTAEEPREESDGREG